MDKGESQRRDAHAKQLSDLRSRIDTKVKYYAQKPLVEPEQLYHLVKEFFLELVDKTYEPTYEELIREIEELDHEFLFFTKHQRSTVRSLLEDLSRMHYGHEQYTSEQTQEVLKKLSETIHDLTTNTQGSIDHLLHQGLKALAQKDVERARESYIQARKQVESLKPEQQQQYQPELQELYSGLKH